MSGQREVPKVLWFEGPSTNAFWTENLIRFLGSTQFPRRPRDTLSRMHLPMVDMIARPPQVIVEVRQANFEVSLPNVEDLRDRGMEAIVVKNHQDRVMVHLLEEVCLIEEVHTNKGNGVQGRECSSG